MVDDERIHIVMKPFSKMPQKWQSCGEFWKGQEVRLQFCLEAKKSKEHEGTIEDKKTQIARIGHDSIIRQLGINFCRCCYISRSKDISLNLWNKLLDDKALPKIMLEVFAWLR